MTNRLQWEVFVSAQIPVVTSDLPPGASEMKWSPISSTLISGKHDAVLVDTAITVDENQKLVRLDRAQRQEFDGNLRNPRPRRSFLWRKHNPEEISEGAVRRDERSHRGYAKAGVGTCG
jgi:hypothetical protein